MSSTEPGVFRDLDPSPYLVAVEGDDHGKD